MRLNLKLLLVLVAVLIVGGVAALVTHSRMSARRFANYVQWGDAAMARDNFEDAAENYARASAMEPNDAALAVKTGDALYQLSATKLESAVKAAEAWERAVRISPQDLNTLRKLFQYELDVAKVSPSLDVFHRIQAAADKIAALDPDDRRAEAYRHAAVVEPWLSGLLKDAPDINVAVDALLAFLQKTPGDDVALSCVTRAKIMRGMEARRAGGAAAEADAAKLFAEAQALAERAEQDAGTNAAGLYRASQAFALLSQSSGGGPGDAAALSAKARAAADRARASVSPKDPLFVDIQLWSAEVANERHDKNAAEAIYKELLAARPGSVEARLVYAQFMGADVSRAREALSLLTPTTPPADERTPGPLAARRRSSPVRNLLLVARLRVLIATTIDPQDVAGRNRALDEAKLACDKATELAGESSAVLKLAAQVLQARHRYVEALQTLDRASELSSRAGEADSEIEYLKAACYVDLQQVGQARSLLQALLARDKGCVPAREMLSQMLIRQGALVEAGQQVGTLETQAPQDPEVLKLRIALLQAGGSPEQIKPYFDRLPETNAAQRLAKAEVAVSLKDHAEAVRLLQLVRSEDPANATATGLLVREHLAQGHPELARAVVADALAHAPHDARLKSFQTQLEDLAAGKSVPVDPKALARSSATQIGDEFERERQLGAVALLQNDAREAREHLSHAARLNADDLTVTEMLFRCDLIEHQWTAAEGRVAVLAKANQDQAGGLSFKIRLALARNKAAEALAFGRELTEQLSQFSDSWVLLGDSQQAALRFEEAIASYNKALFLQGNNVDAFKGLVACQVTLKRPDDAGQAIAQAKQACPGSAEIQALEVQYGLNFGNPRSVVESCEAALQQDPNRKENVLNAGTAHLKLGQAAKARGASPEAAAAFTRARELFARAMEVWPDDQAGYLWGAAAALAGGDATAGEGMLRRFSDRAAWRDRPEPYLLLADFYDPDKQKAQVESALKTALAKDPGRTDIASRLAISLSASQRVDEALAVLAPFFNDPEIVNLAAGIQATAGRLKEAEASLQARIAKNPASAGELAALAMVYRFGGNFTAALDAAERAVAVDHENATALYERGVARLRQPAPQVERGLQDLVAARDRNPANIEMRLALAEAYRGNGQLREALREVEPLIVHAPYNRAVRAMLINLCLADHPQQLDRAQKLAVEAESSPALKSDPIWYRFEGRILLIHGQLTQGVDRFRKALEVAPLDIDSAKDLIEGMYEAKDYQGVVHEADRILSGSSKADWAHFARGRAKQKLGDASGAAVDFDAALSPGVAALSFDAAAIVLGTIAAEVSPDSALQHLAKMGQNGPAWELLKVQLLWQKHDGPNTLAALDPLLRHLMQLTPAQQETALRLAAEAYSTGAERPLFDQTYAAYRKLLERKPADVWALNNLACLLVENASPPRPQEAIVYSQRAYEMMLQSGQFNAAIADTHGSVLTLNGKADEAVRILQRVAKEAPSPTTLVDLAEAYLAQASHEAALKQLQQAQALALAAEHQGQGVTPQLKSRIESDLARASAATQPK